MAQDSTPPASNTVAVADFEVEGAQPDTRDWAFGLADVLGVELQQRGVVLFERQQIRMVLGERRLTASGLMQLQARSPWQIPDVRYLVTGRIGRGTNQQFGLEASLVDAQTGRNAASFFSHGHYPEELPAGLASIAGQIGARLRSGVEAGRVPQGVPPPTPIPEASLLFYKGVAYCLAGQPELGVTWFIDTQKAAPTFLPAKLWTLRAFEMLGLPRFAAVARAYVQAAPNGPGVLNRLNESPFLDKKLVSVAVIPDLRLDAAGLRTATALKTALGRSTNLFVADPSNLRALAAEMDLQLTEKGGDDLELGDVLWSAVDALVFVRPPEDSGAGSLSVELRDAVSSKILYRASTARSDSGLTDLAHQLAQQVAARGKAGLAEAPDRAFFTGRARKPAQVINTDRNEFAGLLRYMAENPGDRPGWQRLALFARWLSPGGIRASGAGYQGAIADSILAATNPNDKDAASWVAAALWHRRYYEYPPPPFAVEFAPLLERYPASPEAQNVLSGVAMDDLDQKNYAQAVKIFLKLQQELPNLPGDVKVGPDYWANFYFFTGVAFYELGDRARAREFISSSELVLKKNPDVGLLPYSLGKNWRNPFSPDHPLLGERHDLREAVLAWQARLNPAPAMDSHVPLTLDQLERLLVEARQASESDARAKQLEYLRRLIEHKQLHPSLYQGRITGSFGPTTGPYREVHVWHQGPTYGYFSQVGKLVNEAIVLLSELAGQQQRDLPEVRQLAHALAENLDASIAANTYEAVGEPALALEWVDKAIRQPSPFPPRRYGQHPTPQQHEARQLRQQKIRLLQALGKSAEAAAYARTQLGQSDADANLAAAVDAAEAYKAIGHADEGCQIFAEFVRAEEAGGKMDNQSAAARLWWAEYEVGRGNAFAATEVLRQVVQQSEGKGWGAYLRHGYVKVYEEALARLGKVRAESKFPVVSSDWEASLRPWESSHPPSAGPLQAEEPQPSDLQRDLKALLQGTKSGPNTTSYGGAPVEAFIKKYGHEAVPAMVQASASGWFNAHLIAGFKLLDRLATPADAPLVLEAFKTAPQLAVVAFRLDRTNATTILAERFAIYAKGGEIPEEARAVVGQYRLRDQYPVLVANLTAKEINGNTAPNAAAVDRVLRRGASSQVRASFRAALAALLEKEMLMNYRYGLAGLSETALRNGVPQGIEAVLRSEDPVSTNSLAKLRKYIDLPADDAAALAAVRSGLGRWRWQPKSRRFVLQPADSPKQAAVPSPDSSRCLLTPG